MSDPIDQDIPVVLLWLDEGLEPNAEMFGSGAKDLTHGPECLSEDILRDRSGL